MSMERGWGVEGSLKNLTSKLSNLIYNRKVVGSTPVGRTRNFFFPSMPVSLLNNTSFSYWKIKLFSLSVVQ